MKRHHTTQQHTPFDCIRYKAPSYTKASQEYQSTMLCASPQQRTSMCVMTLQDNQHHLKQQDATVSLISSTGSPLTVGMSTLHVHTMQPHHTVNNRLYRMNAHLSSAPAARSRVREAAQWRWHAQCTGCHPRESSACSIAFLTLAVMRLRICSSTAGQPTA